MVIVEAASILIGAGGLAFGGYQYYQTREAEQRKNRLKELSDKLNDVRSRLEKVTEGYEDPLSGVDLATQLDLLSKSMLAFKFDTGQNPYIKLREMSDEGATQNKEQSVQKFKSDGTWVDICVVIEDSETDYSTQLTFDIYDHFLYLPTAYTTLAEIREDYVDIVEEFDPGLLDDVGSTMDKVVREAHGRALSNKSGVQIELEKYNYLNEISEEVFNIFWEYEGFEDDLSQLTEEIERIENTRTAILQASYS